MEQVQHLFSVPSSTGSNIGSILTLYLPANVANSNYYTPFTLTSIIPGTKGTSYWLDIARVQLLQVQLQHH